MVGALFYSTRPFIVLSLVGKAILSLIRSELLLLNSAENVNQLLLTVSEMKSMTFSNDFVFQYFNIYFYQLLYLATDDGTVRTSNHEPLIYSLKYFLVDPNVSLHYIKILVIEFKH